MKEKNYSKRALVQSIIGFFTGFILVGFVFNILALVNAKKGVKQSGRNSQSTAATAIAIIGMVLSLCMFIYSAQHPSDSGSKATLSQVQTTSLPEKKEPAAVAPETETQKVQAPVKETETQSTAASAEAAPAAATPAASPASSTEAPSEPAPAAPQADASATSSATISQKNAVAKAQQYLSFTAFSRKSLISQLVYEGFEQADAEYGVDNAGADWNEQAGLKAQNYLDMTAFSKDGLAKQLEFEGFTADQIQAGLTAVGY